MVLVVLVLLVSIGLHGVDGGARVRVGDVA